MGSEAIDFGAVATSSPFRYVPMNARAAPLGPGPPYIQSNVMISGVLLDLAGVIYEGETALPGALEAVNRLRHAGLSCAS